MFLLLDIQLFIVCIELLITTCSDEVKVTHMDLEWDVDFQTKTIAGQVTLSVEKVNTEASSLVHFSIPCLVVMCF